MPAVARPDRGKGAGAEPLPGASRARPASVRLPPSRTASSRAATPGIRCWGTSGARGSGIPALAPAGPGASRSATCSTPARRAHRAAVALLAELRRGGPPRDPVAVRGRRPGPAGPGPEEAEERLKRVHGLEQRRLRACGRAPALASLRAPWPPAGRGRARTSPGRSPTPAVLAELERRDPVGAGTIEKWIECPYRWFVDHELSPQRLEPRARPADSRLDRPRGARAPLLASRPATTGSPARATSLAGDGARRAARRRRPRSRGCEPGLPRTRILMARMRAQIERLLDREAAGETELRPALLEASFGEGADGRSAAARPRRGPDPRPDRPGGRDPGRTLRRRLRLQDRLQGMGGGEARRGGQAAAPALRARPSRPAGRSSRSAASTTRSARGTTPARAGSWPAGIEATEALDLVSTDRLEPEERPGDARSRRSRAPRRRSRRCAQAKSGATRTAAAAPKWCRYQPICRLERSIGAEEVAGNGDAAETERDERRLRPARLGTPARAHRRAAGRDRGALSDVFTRGGRGHRQDAASSSSATATP